MADNGTIIGRNIGRTGCTGCTRIGLVGRIGLVDRIGLIGIGKDNKGNNGWIGSIGLFFGICQKVFIMAISFEFFPPKTEAATKKLWQVITRLAPIGPDFVSVTYGAGGSTRDRTYNCVKKIAAETDLQVAGHLTCVAAERAAVDAMIEAYAQAGIRHIVALRGDMPDMQPFRPATNGYSGSVELVAAIAARGGFEISVSAYPERHPESASMAADIELLKAKIDAGACRAITQFVLETEHHLRFRDLVAAANITVPLVPGIMTTTNFASICKMAEKCHIAVPDALAARYAGLEDDADARLDIAIDIAVEQCRTLLAAGFEDLHFYTMNQAELPLAVCRILHLGKNPDALMTQA